jgi:hypothetical protein
VEIELAINVSSNDPFKSGFVASIECYETFLSTFCSPIHCVGANEDIDIGNAVIPRSGKPANLAYTLHEAVVGAAAIVRRFLSNGGNLVRHSQ